MGIYDSLSAAQDALEIKNVPDNEAWIESLPSNQLISNLSVKRECFAQDGAWVSFEDPINAEYNIV